METKYYFEYGITTAYGSKTAETSVGSGGEFVAVSAPLAGLAPGTSYHYRLVATNSRGTTIGKDKEFETLGGKPIARTEPIYTLGYTSATLKGEVYGKGETTQFYFEYGTTEAYGQSTAEHEIAGTRYEEEIEAVSGLTPGVRYHYRIVATNSYGTSYGADKSFSTPHEPLAETDAPEAVGYDDATLSGTIDPRGTKSSYHFEYGTSQSYGAHTAEVTVGSGTSNVQAMQSVDYLAEDTTYHFRVVASTIYGTTYGADRTFSTGIKPSVQTGAATMINTEGATLSGTINPHGANLTYYFEYGLTPEYGMSTSQIGAGSGQNDLEASQAIAALSPNTTYHYRLVAVDGSAKIYGSEVMFTTNPLPPPVEVIAPPGPVTPLAPPVIGPAPPLPPVSSPSPGPAHGGLSFQATRHGDSLSVLLELDRRAVRVEVSATAPEAQLRADKPRGHRVSVVLARAVRTDVELGHSKLVLRLDAKGRRTLRARRRLTLTVTVTLTTFSGERQTAFVTLTLI